MAAPKSLAPPAFVYPGELNEYNIMYAPFYSGVPAIMGLHAECLLHTTLKIVHTSKRSHSVRPGCPSQRDVNKISMKANTYWLPVSPVEILFI